jgi:predicted NACHT family NTPase
MLCAVHHDRRQDLPAERSRLYRDCVDMLLNRRDPGRKIVLSEDYPHLTETQRERLAQSVAYWLMKNGYSDAAVEDVDRHLNSVLTLMDVRHTNGAGVRSFLVERTNLLREPVTGRIDFTHRTFQEYLAAIAAVQTNDFGVLLDHSRDDQWREMIILAMGIAGPTDRVPGWIEWRQKAGINDAGPGGRSLSVSYGQIA